MKIINLLKRKKGKSLEEIVAGCCKGDAGCQKELFEKYGSTIMTIGRRYEHADFGASDILQETFILVFKNIKRFDSSKASFETWIKKIAMNVVLNMIRSRKMKFLDIDNTILPLENLDDTPSYDEKLSEELLLKIIGELPDGYRTIFNLFVVEGYSHKEIASILNISIQTSKSQLSKAKKMLRKKINNVKISRNKQNAERI